MPRLSEETKDVVSCEKLRGAANEYRSVDVRMGEPVALKARRIERSILEPAELKHLIRQRKREQ